MTPSSPRSLSFLSAIRKFSAGCLFLLGMAIILTPAAHAAPAATSTTLVISSTSVPYKTPITLTATVTSSGVPASSGLVLFCEATATYCENNSALGVAQLTSPNGTATVKIGSGPIGIHQYKAVYRANNSYLSSMSNTVSYSVTGTYNSLTTLAASGVPGNYTLKGSIAGIGSLTTGPTGTVSFLDTSVGNNVLGSQNLVVSTLSNTFAANPPFTIGGGNTTLRSVSLASAYLDGDNNLDVVTGDAAQTITVLLGNGDGSFKPKVNYPGCTVGRAMQVVLADFNRDGNTDVALGCSDGTNGGLIIIMGNGDGSFQTPVAYLTGDVFGIALGDFNNDGLIDIAVSDQTQKNITIFLGAGNGTFSATGSTITTPDLAHGIVVGDFNQDGNDDLAYAVTTSVNGSTLSDLYVALGKGDGTFQTPTKVATGIGEFLTAGDVNADNLVDVVAATITRPGGGNIGNSLFVLLGKGNGTFNPTVTYVSDIPSDPHLTDVNGDGIPDIIAGGSSGALVYQGKGDGTFLPYQEPSIGGFALTYAVNAGDYNNDGNADLIGTDADTPHAAVSLSQVQQTSDASALTGVAVLPLGSGIHQVDAKYSGDSIYIGSTSTTVPLTAAQVPTNLTLSVSPTSATLSGQAVTLTATLNPYTVGPPTTTTDGETIRFYNSGTLIGTGVLNAGVATLVTTSLPVGSVGLQASFAGDSNYKASSSNTVTVTVSAVTLTSSLNPSTYQQSVTFTATLITGKTGTVTFMDGAIALGTSTIVGITATLTTSTLSVGSHDITAIYNSSTSPILTQVVNKAIPTVTVTTSGPSVYGDTVTITATVPTGVTGTITLTSGTTTLGTGTIAGGVVTITTATLPVGSNPITATYNGDGNYASATGTTTQTVAKASPTSTLTSSKNPSLFGDSVTFTDTLSATVTGTVTFTSGATPLGTSTLVNGVATVTTSTLPIGSDPITATYGGNSNNNSSVATLTQTVAKATPTVAVTTSGPSTYGDPVTITTTLPSGTTGTVTVTSGGTTLGTGTIGPGGTVTIITTTLPVGTDTITSTYSGDNNNNPATGTTTQTVAKVAQTITLLSSVNPSTVHQSVTFTATMATGLTGTVTFLDGATPLGTGALVNGVASLATSTLAAGAHVITASYAGDSNNGAAVSTPLTQTVNKLTPVLPIPVVSSTSPIVGTPETITETVPAGVSGPVTFYNGATPIGTAPIVGGVATITVTNLPLGTAEITATTPGDADNNPATSPAVSVTVVTTAPEVTLTSSLNPSIVNQPVTFTATVPAGATGTITFHDGATILGTGTVVGGHATLTTSTLTVGAHTITASYGGDTNNSAATSVPLTQFVNKATPVLPPPGVSNPNPTTGTPVTITETVPTGVDGPVTFYDGSTPIGTAPIVNGVATITVSNLPIGADPITASTPGDANNNPATSPAVTVTVAKAVPTVTLVSSANPSAPNAPVTFTATTYPGATAPVTFYDGSTILGVGTVNGAGVATLTTSSLPIGSHSITASYEGDATHSAGTSAVLLQIVGKIPTMITVTASSPAQLFHSEVTFTAIVTAPLPTPTGTVTFMDGTTILGTVNLSTNGGGVIVSLTTGNAAFITGGLATGDHHIVAVYSGDNTFQTSTSAPADNTVEDFTNVNSGPASQNVFPGDSTSYNFKLTPISASTFLNDVTFTVTGLPEGSTYTVTPASITAGSGATGVVLKVQTSSSLSAQNHTPLNGPNPRNEVPIALGMLGLAGLGTIRKLRRKLPRPLLVLLLMLGTLLPIAALSGCGGGYFTLTPHTYTVTLTGTEGSIQHSATATLVVQ